MTSEGIGGWTSATCSTVACDNISAFTVNGTILEFLDCASSEARSSSLLLPLPLLLESTIFRCGIRGWTERPSEISGSDGGGLGDSVSAVRVFLEEGGGIGGWTRDRLLVIREGVSVLIGIFCDLMRWCVS